MSKISYYIWMNIPGVPIIFKVIIGKNNILDKDNGITYTYINKPNWTPVNGWSLQQVKLTSEEISETDAFIKLL